MGLQDCASRSLPTDRHIVRIIRRILRRRTRQYRSRRHCCRNRNRITHGHSVRSTDHIRSNSTNETPPPSPTYHETNNRSLQRIVRVQHNDVPRRICNWLHATARSSNIKHGTLDAELRKHAWNQSSNIRSRPSNEHNQPSARVQASNKISSLTQLFLGLVANTDRNLRRISELQNENAIGHKTNTEKEKVKRTWLTWPRSERRSENSKNVRITA